jgi:hypothetical protein
MSIDLEPAKLLSLHGLTKDVSQFCQRHLKTQIDAMAPLFRPRRFLGDHIDSTGKEAVAGADRNIRTPPKPSAGGVPSVLQRRSPGFFPTPPLIRSAPCAVLCPA